MTAKPQTHNSRELSIASNFVLQYYTFLNKAPHLAHRFYSDDSTLIHGALEKPGERTKPVVGLQKIKQKLDDLSFCDCRVKVRQIDCLTTLQRGLLIQVIGELSNNGEPMRRFVQTFVLAPGPNKARQSRGGAQGNHKPGGDITSEESNAKFYVLNDIFRYQDDRYDEEEQNVDSSQKSSVAGDHSQPVKTNIAVAPASSSAAAVAPPTAVATDAVRTPASPATPNAAPAPANFVAATVVNHPVNSSKNSHTPKISGDLASSLPPHQQTEQASKVPMAAKGPPSDFVASAPTSVPTKTAASVTPQTATASVPAPNVATSSFAAVPSMSEPKTWANRVLRGTTGITPSPPANSNASNAPAQQASSTSSVSASAGTSAKITPAATKYRQ